MNIDVSATVQRTFDCFHWGGTSWSFKGLKFEKKSGKNVRQIVSYEPYFSQKVEITDQNYLISLTRKIPSLKGNDFDVFEIQVFDTEQKLLYAKKQRHYTESEQGNLLQVLPVLKSCSHLKLMAKPSLVKMAVVSKLKTK